MTDMLDYPAELYRSKNKPTYVESIDLITEKDITFFDRNGYLAIQKVFDQHEITVAKSEIQRLLSGDSKSFDGIQYENPNKTSDNMKNVRKIMGFVNHSTHLYKMATDPNLVDLIIRLSHNSSPILFQDMALLKGPGGREKPWHQDAAYFDLPIDTVVIGVWIALDPATEENGCLHIIPKTHKNGPAEHFQIRDWQLCDTEILAGLDVAVPLEPGGCLLWHGLLHHGSPKNNTQKTRQALQYHYRPKSCKQTSADERLKHFGGSVRGATC